MGVPPAVAVTAKAALTLRTARASESSAFFTVKFLLAIQLSELVAPGGAAEGTEDRAAADKAAASAAGWGRAAPDADRRHRRWLPRERTRRGPVARSGPTNVAPHPGNAAA